jgi:phage baseplate assembly protein V
MRGGFSPTIGGRTSERARLTDGAVIGIVTNITDPDGLSRVRVKFPSISDQDESFWARIAVPMAGDDRGTYFPLAVDDEVLVIFGHLREPFVVGALWNGKEKPPASRSDQCVIKSRSGHVIRLNDAGGNQTVEIVDGSGKNGIVIDTTNNTITISAQKDITLSAPKGTITLAAQKVVMKASVDGELSAGAGGMKVHADGDLTVTGKTVNLN